MKDVDFSTLGNCVSFISDFLDSSDTTLAFAVFGMTQVHTFPIAIFTVKNSMGKEELLLCYNGKGTCWLSNIVCAI